MYDIQASVIRQALLPPHALQVSTSEAVDVDYLTPSVYGDLEVVATSNSSGGGVRVDMLLLDLCLPCDMDTLRQPG